MTTIDEIAHRYLATPEPQRARFLTDRCKEVLHNIANKHPGISADLREKAVVGFAADVMARVQSLMTLPLSSPPSLH